MLIVAFSTKHHFAHVCSYSLTKLQARLHTLVLRTTVICNTYRESVTCRGILLLFVKKVSYMKLIEVLRRMESFETNTIDGDTLVFLIYIQFLLQ